MSVNLLSYLSKLRADEKEEAKRNKNAPPSSSTVSKLVGVFSGSKEDGLQKSASQETLSQGNSREPSINEKSPRDKSPLKGIKALISGNKSKSSGSLDKAEVGGDQPTPGLAELMREEAKKWKETTPGLQDLMKDEVKKWNGGKSEPPGLQELMREEVKKWKVDQGAKTSSQANRPSEAEDEDDDNDDTVSQYQNMIRDQESDENRSPSKKGSTENVGAKVILNKLEKKPSKDEPVAKQPEKPQPKKEEPKNDEEEYGESDEDELEDEHEVKLAL